MLSRLLSSLVVFLVLMSSSVVLADETPAKKIMLASTIGPIDAGIVGALEEVFTKKTGIVVEHIGAGTGQALKMAETGKYDLVLVHAKALEEKFVAEGFGTKRYDLMYNDFVILGPDADPAHIRGMKDAAAALRRIADAKVLFVTRGDKSGTHVKELDVWKKAGIEPKGAWYVVFEQGAKGNAPTLAYANEKQAYTDHGPRHVHHHEVEDLPAGARGAGRCSTQLYLTHPGESCQVPAGPPQRSHAVRRMAPGQRSSDHHP